jgi:arylsulfatase
MVGKWHLTKDSHCSDAGPFDSWPVQRGFDRFYGFLDGFTNLHHPHRLIDGNSPVTVDTYPEGYYLTDDLTDRAVEMLQAKPPIPPFSLLQSRFGACAAAPSLPISRRSAAATRVGMTSGRSASPG